MDHFDQVHVVSDLHLGGEPGFQIFNQGDALARLIRHLAGAPGPVALVLNGDVVDFLAADPPVYFASRDAVAKLAKIIEADAFRGVFLALNDFTREADKRLVLILGNHDVELALPEVRALLLEKLGADAAARGRIIWAMDGKGYTCTVGGHAVHCLHGNAQDDWNVVDPAALERLSRDPVASRGELQPNAGTRLVIDVMNPIKRRYAWVDLLKPETTIVPAILYTLPDVPSPPLGKFAKTLYTRGETQLRRNAVFLGAEGSADLDEVQALEMLLRAGGHGGQGGPGGRDGLAWIEQAAADFAQGVQPEDLAPPDDADVRLGLRDDLRLAIHVALPRDNPEEKLRLALQRYLAGDATFEFDTEDETYQAIDKQTPADVTFIVAGHTHLHRCIPRRRHQGFYFNSGTWIRLMQIPPKKLASREAFKPVYDLLTAEDPPGENMARLDRSELVVNRRSFVSIWVEENERRTVRSELRSAFDATEGRPGEAPWRSVFKAADVPVKR